MTGWDVFTCFIIGTVVTVAYSAIGGILAITYTTWVQFILIILGTVVLGIPLSAKAMGGFGGVSALPSEWFDLGRYGPATIIALGVSSVFSFYTSMDSYQRSFAAKSPRIAKNGTLWAALSIVFIAFGATYMGMSAKVLIPELPEGVLAGGRYDKLAQRVSGAPGAVGFAVYTDLLERLGRPEPEYDADVAIVSNGRAAEALSKACELRKAGKSVMIDGGGRCREIIEL